MNKREEFELIKKSLLTLFVLVSILITFSSIKVLALNEEIVTSVQYNNKLVSGNSNNNMTLPGSNMTFGSSLDNAKMHLLEAIMDIKGNNINGALMQLNITNNDIKMHEQEMADMMLMIKMKEVDQQ